MLQTCTGDLEHSPEASPVVTTLDRQPDTTAGDPILVSSSSFTCTTFWEGPKHVSFVYRLL